MKIEFERDVLQNALAQLGGIVERKTTMPILANVILDAKGDQLWIGGTNLEVAVQTTCPVKTTMDGRVCIPARSLQDLVRELPENKGRLKKGENEWLVIESGKAHFKVVGMVADEYPQMPDVKKFKFAKLKSTSLRESIEKTFFAISSDEMRYNLNGALMETRKEGKGPNCLRMIATDGHRLALAEHPLSEEEGVVISKGIILPRRGVMELRRLLSEDAPEMIEFAVADGVAAFRIGPTFISMRLVVGDFPDYNAVVPKTNTKRLMIQRDVLLNSLRRVSLFAEGKSRCVRFEIRGNGLHLAANSPEVGEAEEDLPGEMDGGELKIGFNAKYVLDALNAVSGEKVLFELDHAQSPGIIRNPDFKGTFGVVMPMRL